MNCELNKSLSSFFNAYTDGRPILLALSGGGDSMALFYLLLELGKPFHVAHVDHGWRRESQEEAEILRSLAEKEGIPFHLHRIVSIDPQKNLESSAREERLQFFEEVCLTYNLQAVLTAHHADDQAETVMSRFVTQAPLEKFAGMIPLTYRGSLTLWRPLLKHQKKELIAYLQERNKIYFDDSTNGDLRRTRSCFRHQVLPAITEMTGRDAIASLLSLQEQVQETKDFLEAFVAPFLLTAKKGALGWLWKIDPQLLQFSAPLKFALRSFFVQVEFPFHREIAEKIVTSLQQRLANRVFESGGKVVIVDRGVLMVPRDHWNEKPPVWSFSIESIETQEKGYSSSWEDVWDGYFHALLPVDNVKLLAVNLNTPYPGHQPIRHWWNKHKVPAYMRSLAPLVVNAQGKVVHEFLTGKVTWTDKNAVTAINGTQLVNCINKKN